MFTNTKKPEFRLVKTSADGSPLDGVTFRISPIGDASHSIDRTTQNGGEILVEGLEPGIYSVQETATLPNHILDKTEYHVELSPGKTSELRLKNDKRPSIKIIKENSITHERQAHVPFQVWYASNNTSTGEYNDLGVFYTDENGRVVLTEPDIFLRDGWFRVKELEAPHGFALADPDTQEAFIPSGTSHTFLFQDRPLSAICVWKYDSVSPNMAIEGAVFQIRYLSGNTSGTGGTVIGTYRTGQNGSFTATGLPAGTYVIEELSSDGDHVIDTPPQTIVVQAGKTVTVTMKNQPRGKLIIQKRDSQTNQVLPGAQFRITTAAGCEVGLDGVIGTATLTSNGIFTTDSQGEIRISNLAPGAYVIFEIKAPDNYVMDNPSTNVVIGPNGDTQTVIVTNTPKATLTILKRDAVTKKPLANAEFIVRDSEGHAVGPTNGIYKTGTDGTVVVSGLVPGATIMVSETKAPSGYILDETPKHIVVKSGISNSLIFDDEPGTTLIIQKFIEGTENEPLSRVCFKVSDGSGAAVGPDDGVYDTDHAGEIVLNGIEPGTTVKAREIKTVDGFVLDGTPQDILIKGGEVQRLTFWNKRAGTLVLQKKDSVSGSFISGAQFQLTYASGGFVDNDNGHLSSNGLYTTDDKGEIRISGITGTVVAKEVKAAPGYVIDQSTQTQTVTVNPLDTQTLVFLNEPLCSLTLRKLDATNGKPVPNTEFTLKDGDGNILGRYTTGADGTVTVTAKEIRVPDGVVLDPTPKSIKIEGGIGGQTLRFVNQRAGNLILNKVDGIDKHPLSGVTFKITYADGSNVDQDGGKTSSNGIYTTDANGQIKISNVVGTVKIMEIETVPGYYIDEKYRTQTVEIKSNDTQTVTVYNVPTQALVIQKFVTGSKDQPLAGVEFLVTDSDGTVLGPNNGIYKTDQFGRITIKDLTPGTVITARETKSLDGYVLDSTPLWMRATITVWRSRPRRASSSTARPITSLSGIMRPPR